MPVRKIYRNAKNGRFVKKAYVERHPDTTVTETLKKAAPRRKKK